jgi:enoyl-CoA hydratase
MPASMALAREIASCEPETIVAYKRLMDQGGRSTLEKGLQLEAEAYEKQARNFSSEAVAARREAVQQRGRKQKGT